MIQSIKVNRYVGNDPKWHRHTADCNRESLLVLAGRAVDATRAVGGGAAPDALVGAEPVTMLAHGRMDAPRAIAHATAISAFRAHVAYYSTVLARVRTP